MRLELNPGALRLGRGQVLKVVDGGGSTICCREGEVWVTEEGRQADVVLAPGRCYRLAGRGVALVTAFGDAAVSLA